MKLSKKYNWRTCHVIFKKQLNGKYADLISFSCRALDEKNDFTLVFVSSYKTNHETVGTMLLLYPYLLLISLSISLLYPYHFIFLCFPVFAVSSFQTYEIHDNVPSLPVNFVLLCAWMGWVKGWRMLFLCYCSVKHFVLHCMKSAIETKADDWSESEMGGTQQAGVNHPLLTFSKSAKGHISQSVTLFLLKQPHIKTSHFHLPSGISTYGTTAGWPDRTCLLAMEAGRLLTPLHRKQVRAPSAVAPHPSTPSVPAKSTSNMTRLLCSLRWVVWVGKWDRNLFLFTTI